VIVSTHEYVAWPWEGWRSPVGENIYQKLVNPHADQIFLVFCGHLDVEDHRTETVGEYFVYEVVSDYQEESNGGNGWLKILEFSPLHDKIFVRTYSPYLDAYHSNPDSHFTLDYNMTSIQSNITIQMINSALSDFVFDNPNYQINFTVSGEPGTIGYFNITIPHHLNLGNSWDIKVDGESSRDQKIHPEKGVEWTHPSQNTTHTSLFFKYMHSDSPYQISIVGTEVVPEFTPAIILPMFVIATLMVIIFYKRKLRAHRSDCVSG
jgi:hypothetical protein